MSGYDVARGKLGVDVGLTFDALKEEVDRREDHHRRVNGIVAILLVLLIAVALYLDAQADSLRNQLRQTNAEMQVLAGNVASDYKELARERELRVELATSVQGLRDIILVSPKPEPTVTAVPTATPKTEMYSIDIPKWGLSNFGTGGYQLNVSMFIDPEGSMDKVTAEGRVDSIVKDFFRACPAEGRYGESNYHSRGIFSYRSTSGKGPVAETCWRFFEDLTGVKPTDRLSGDVLNQLRPYANTNSVQTLFVSDQGRILGVWRNGVPPMGKACLDLGLRENGYQGEGYFTLTPMISDLRVSQILDEAGFIGNWLDIPDFCEKGNLTKVTQPEWVKVTQDSAGYMVETNEKKQSWVKLTRDELSGRLWVWEPVINKGGSGKVDYRPKGTIGDDDLVAIPKGDSCNGVFLRFNGKDMSWYQAGAGCALNIEGWGNKIASVFLIPFTDGFGPYVQISQKPLAYQVEGKMIRPGGAKLF